MKMVSAVALLLVLACSDERKDRVPLPRTAAAEPAVAAEADFVPADAQARAEAVLNADFNKNKKTTLQMKMTSIIGRTSSLDGFSTAVKARQDSIEDKLSRLNARVTDTEVVIQLPGSILFDFDSAAIRTDAERALEDLRQVIGSYAARPVRIEGHTDSMASDEYNLGLSARRAASVADWLKAHGVEPGRIATRGLGETKPAASNETSEGRQKNRRVEVIIAKN
jgi:outer membrane protein OmpA-like peptidoglycan-associated protein